MLQFNHVSIANIVYSSCFANRLEVQAYTYILRVCQIHYMTTIQCFCIAKHASRKKSEQNALLQQDTKNLTAVQVCIYTSQFEVSTIQDFKRHHH